MKRIPLSILKNRKFGRLTVLCEKKQQRSNSGQSFRLLLCKCDCGKLKEIKLKYISNGDTRSCGCLQPEVTIKRSTRHGMTPSGSKVPSEYSIWSSMIQRCENKNDKDYYSYGGRGISVCKRWHKFINFFNDMGKKPTDRSIDRINNDKGYYPKNCRWATRKQQQNNRRPYRKK